MPRTPGWQNRGRWSASRPSCERPASALLVAAHQTPSDPTVPLPTVGPASRSGTVSPATPLPKITGVLMLVTASYLIPLSLLGDSTSPCGAGTETLAAPT